MRIFYKDGCRYIYITGYGCLSRNLLIGLNKYEDLDIFIQGIGREWEEIEPHFAYPLAIMPRHTDQKEWDVTFQVMPPPYLTYLKNSFNFCYTQNAISKILPLWLEALQKQDCIIVPSKFDYDVFKKEGLENVYIVHQGADYNFYTPIEPPDPKPFVFLNVGTFNFRKGQDILLKAFKIAFGDDPNVQLYLKPGRGDYSLLFERWLNEIGLKGNNIILDSRLASPQEMVDLYHKVHCVVNPSRGEGWNMPITEGMSCGLPVISTYATAMLDYMTEDNSFPLKAEPKMIKDYEKTWWTESWLNGYSAIPEGELYEVSPYELANRMVEVYQEYDKARLRGIQGRQDIISKWSWESAVDKIYKIIKTEVEEIPKRKKGVVIEETRKIKDMEFK